MKYDASKIKTKYEIINGKKIKIEIIPPGMCGKNALAPFSAEDFETEEPKSIHNDAGLQREYREYTEEGTDPDSDEVISIKERIEKDNSFQYLDDFESLVEEASEYL